MRMDVLSVFPFLVLKAMRRCAFCLEGGSRGKKKGAGQAKSPLRRRQILIVSMVNDAGNRLASDYRLAGRSRDLCTRDRGRPPISSRD